MQNSPDSPVIHSGAEVPPAASKPRKRKRPRVPEEQRQRASVACGSCRRLKEKCDGNIPCSRCQRYNRTCMPASNTPRNASSPLDRKTDGFENERVRHLEFIARHFLGDIPLTDDALAKIVSRLESEHDGHASQKPSSEEETPALDEERFTHQTISRNITHYSGEFSHWNFSLRLKQKVEQQLQSSAGGDALSAYQVLDYWRANHLKSRERNMRSILTSLPPRDIAMFFTDAYFKHAQINTFFVEEGWARERIDALYQPDPVFTADDACWLCSALMVLAVGTQFGHMSPHTVGDDSFESFADAVGMNFYQMAANMIPDVIAIASVDSVQAFLLLAHYALPLDAHGVAYTYLGLALKMAIQNGMHRKYHGNDLDSVSIDLRNRLWWSVYGLEKRISILHGRPTSISSSEIDAEYPTDRNPGHPIGSQARLYENALTKTTDWLGDIAFVIHMLRKAPHRLRHAYFERLLQVRQQYLDWWRSANIPIVISTRAIAHLQLAYHLNIVYMGRPFMLSGIKVHSTSRSQSNAKAEMNQRWTELARDAVTSACEVIAVCQRLHDSIGLCKASYREFSSCRAAVLVLLAQCLTESSKQLRDTLAKAMQLVAYMSTANASTRSEASLMASIDAAVHRLDAQRGVDATVEVAETLNNFKKWASRFNEEAPAQPDPGLDDPFGTAGATLDMQDTFGDFNWSPLDASIFDEAPIDFEGLGMHHFDEAFSIAHGAQDLLYTQPQSQQP